MVKHQSVSERNIQVGDTLDVLSHWDKKVDGGYMYCYLVASQNPLINTPIVLYHNEIKLILDN